MNRFTALLLPVAALVSVALAAQAAPPPSAVKAGIYTIDSAHTLVRFTVDHLGFNEYFGTFPDATGSLVLDPARLSATKLDVSLPVARVSTTNAALDGELTGAEWFDAAKYPTIRFVSQTITETGPRTARIAGTLTMHGVSKPMTLNATLGGAGINPMTKTYTVGFKGTGTVKRSDFGVSKYLPLIGDAVTLSITAAFEQK